MSDSSINMAWSINLEKAFEDYRNTEKYKKELEERKKALKVFWIFEEFAGVLAEDSIETWIKVSELLDAKDEIVLENDIISNTISSESENIFDLVWSVSNNRVYWWTWIR